MLLLMGSELTSGMCGGLHVCVNLSVCMCVCVYAVEFVCE